MNPNRNSAEKFNRNLTEDFQAKIFTEIVQAESEPEVNGPK